ncbi:uncharacterized protein LOC129798873 isoform X2 [Phlebotomus papatasi]|uniref:uncharacterized protein LOC129798873 isoform X2 n=1 Tax=Phlebotomus papatasi TaxID=29031 RepID=UPI002483BD72|nr:uncharacterized protein LOC129798873 isoform X2 [Phlebotomus papatasi]
MKKSPILPDHRKSGQASCQQKEKLLIGMEENWKILSCTPRGPEQRAQHKEAWERLTRELNSMAPHDGPWKTAEEWKKVWMDMKYFAMTKKRAQAAAEGRPVYYSGRHAKIIRLSMSDGKEGGQSGNSSGIDGFDSIDESMNVRRIDGIEILFRR